MAAAVECAAELCGGAAYRREIIIRAAEVDVVIQLKEFILAVSAVYLVRMHV